MYCHLCGAQHYRYDHCVQCERQTLVSYSAFEDGNYCDDCISAAGDQYIQMLIDIERGK